MTYFSFSRQKKPLNSSHEIVGTTLPDPDPAPLADAVDRPRGIVADAPVPDVQVDEHVVREAVARVERVEVEQLERLEVHGRVAGLRVGHVPVARRDLRQEREDRVADVAGARDQLPRLAGEEPVRLRVVALARADRADERLEVVGIHLAVGSHHAGDVDLLCDRPPVAGDDRRPDALVPLVRDHLDARVGTARPRAGPSFDASSTTKIRSTNAGIAETVDPTSAPRCTRGRRPRRVFPSNIG